MLYEALVIDNSDFAEKGTIRVRIKDKTNSPILTRDLSIDPKKNIEEFGGQSWITSYGEKKFKYTDTDVRVASQIGGGYNYGLFYLPQPNSWGIVAKLGNSWENEKEDYVWIGSIYERNNRTYSINIPSDSLDNNKAGVEGNGIETDVITNINNINSAIVLKTKSTYISGGAKNIDQKKSIDTLDWEKRPSENLVIVDKDKVKISHNILNDKEESKAVATLNIDEEGFNLSFYNKETDSTSNIKLDNKGNFEIVKDDENIQEKVSGDEEGIVAEYSDGNEKSASLRLGGKPNGLPANYKAIANLTAYENGKSSCSISVKSNGIDIESAGDVNINPAKNGKVSIGGTGLPVLVSPTGQDVLVGNVTIPCSTNLFG